MLDVVVVSYRSPEDLTSFLLAYQQLPDGAERNLTVVEVDPRDGDVEAVEKLAARSCGDYCIMSENVGYGKACNMAAARKSGGIIAFFNADTRILPGVLDQCVDAMNENPDWAILGPRQTNGQGRITHAGIVGTHRQPRLRGWKEHDSERFGDVREVVSVSGSAYFIRRDVWDELTTCPIYRTVAPRAEGAFLPTPLYYEETWCSYHAHTHGYPIIYYGPATMIHRSGSHSTNMMKKGREMFRAACDAHGIEHD